MRDRLRLPRVPRRLLPVVPAALLLTGFAACGGSGSQPGGGASTAFDGEAALADVRTQLDFGPRIPGTDGHRRTGDWLVQRLTASADTVIEQRWSHVTARGDTLPLRNVLARINPQASQRVLFLAHWDTRPISDGAGVPADQRALPVPGANDGASGVAVLLQMAEAFRKAPPSVGVDLLFVDGEDYGDFGTDTDVLLGSRYFVQHLPAPGWKPLYGVLLDMIGDADLQIFQEGNSVQRAPEVVTRVWQTARDLGLEWAFRPEARWTVTDDHIPFLDAGFRVIDVIDLDYPHHHTPQDGFDKVSARSLQVVGDVMVTLVR
jgi:Zn-dependent M28 family amino/carboxypeptidase